MSKRVQGAAVYVAPAHLRAGAVNDLTRVDRAPPLVTDGSFSSDGRLVLRDYLRAYVSAGIGAPSTPLALPLQMQGESVTWTADGSAVLVGSEGERSAVWRVPAPVSEASPSGSVEPGPSGSEVDPPTSPRASPAAETASDGGGPAPWVIVLVGLAVGAGLSLLVRRLGRGRRVP